MDHSLAVGELLLDGTEPETSALHVHLWRPAEQAVVLGSACRLSLEVNSEACRKRCVAIYRRITGGGTVVVGPGTWCYTFVWTRALEPGTIEGAFAQVHTTIIEALATINVEARSEPISDLAVDVPDRGLCKIAGHGQKRRRTGTLCGGSLLAAPFPFSMAEILRHPPREPPYRQGRSHEEFLTNLKALGRRAGFDAFVEAVATVLGIRTIETVDSNVGRRAQALARDKYNDRAWTERL